MAVEAGLSQARSNSLGSIVFVTDELFLPEHNGSSRVYANVARTYREYGHRIYAASFIKALSPTDPVVVQSYQNLFESYLFLSGWNAGGPIRGRLNQLTREIRMSLTGNIFATPFPWERQAAAIGEQFIGFVADNQIDTIYFHKVHTLLLLKSAIEKLLFRQDTLKIMRPTRIIVDLHDDFVERAKHYEGAYRNVFGAMGLKDKAKLHTIALVRSLYTSINESVSRRHELELLKYCDDIIVASDQEFTRYNSFPELKGKVHHKPWPFPVLSSGKPHMKAPTFHGGIIGSDDVMNLDGFLFFQEEILPLIRQRRPDFRLLVAGSIARKIAPLIKDQNMIKDQNSLTVWPKLERVETFYDAIGVSIVPLRYGTGVSIKVLEALEHGCPVVSTTVGVRGLPRERLDQVQIADDPAGFAAAVAALM